MCFSPFPPTLILHVCIIISYVLKITLNYELCVTFPTGSIRQHAQYLFVVLCVRCEENDFVGLILVRVGVYFVK